MNASPLLDANPPEQYRVAADAQSRIANPVPRPPGSEHGRDRRTDERRQLSHHRTAP
jgi:cell division protein FtsN